MASFFLFLIYATFISLGLPDSLIGVAWPVMQPEMNVPYSYAGFISMCVAGCTIIASLNTGKFLRRFGTGRVTLFSVLLTAGALLGFSISPGYLWLILLALPLGLGGGAVDSGLNAYVARHYKAHHMNWLHCFWGVGAMVGPLVMAAVIRQTNGWRGGFLSVGILQTLILLLLFFSLPLWQRFGGQSERPTPNRNMPDSSKPVTDRLSNAADMKTVPTLPKKPPTLMEILRIHGTPIASLAFLFYCGLEASMGLWGSSYLIRIKGLDVATAASWSAMFFGGVTAGRFLSGFLSMKFSNAALLKSGTLLAVAGTVLLMLPLGGYIPLASYILIGLGCAPLFPSMLHETPVRFGNEHSLDIIGVQIATAYLGTTLLPPLFGFVASERFMSFFPMLMFLYGAAVFACNASLSVMLMKKR